MKLLFVLLAVSLRLAVTFPTVEDQREEVDGESSRKIIGQSVVTSVSVIMNGAGEQPQFTDAVGKTVPRPFVQSIRPQLASPINLLNPDRYEFYTFNDIGELVKRLMTLKEIQSIVANGNGAMIGDNEPESQSVLLNTIPLSNQGAETKVQDIVDNVQSVLSREMENNKNISQIPSQLLDTPDVSSSWSMILPAIFGNTGEQISPHKPINMTPETEIVDTTTFRPATIRKATTKVPLTTVPTTKAAPTFKTTESTFAPTKTQTKAHTTATTKRQTVRVKSRPTTTTVRSTTARSTEALIEASEAPTRTYTRPSSTTQKFIPTKKILKKPTPASYKRPLTNSPIIIEKIPKRPHPVESKTGAIAIESKTERVTEAPSTTIEMKSNTPTKAQISVKPTTSITKETTHVSRTEAPSTTAQTTTEKPRVTTTTTKKIVPETTLMMTEQTTLSASEEDRQDTAINQIIGSLQSNLFKTYEKLTTTDQPLDETTVNEMAMNKIGDLDLVPDKVLLNDQLIVDEAEPIVRDLPTTTDMPVDETTKGVPTSEKLEATTTKSKLEPISLENSEVMQTIEKLIQEQSNVKGKPEKPDVLAFDDDDETEIKLKGTLETKKNLTHSEYITKAATVASILSTKLAEVPTTTTQAASEESDTTVPTILSDALSNVIELMLREQELRKTTQKPPAEPSDFDLTKLLQHYEALNYSGKDEDQLEALSLLNEKFITTRKSASSEVTAIPEEESTTIIPQAEELTTAQTPPVETEMIKIATMTKEPESVSIETMVVRETSSVSMKTEDNPQEAKTESDPKEMEKLVATTDGDKQEFSTFFFVDEERETTLDPLHDGLGEFTTEQFVASEKRFSDRKEEFETTPRQAESDEDSNELVFDVLSAIGIASDEEDEASTEKSKDDSKEDKEVDDVIDAFSKLSSTVDKTLESDVKSDFKLTSKLASSLSDIAETISDTLVGDDDSDEESTVIPTTILPDVKDDSTTILNDRTEKSPKSSEESETESSEEEISTGESQEEITTEGVKATTKTSEKPSPMLHLSVIRKDNSLEEINFITPPTPTSTRIPITEGNFIKIESIEQTSTETPKLSGFKNKGTQVLSNVKPIFVAIRGGPITSAKSSTLPEVAVSLEPEAESRTDEPIPTERVPLIEASTTTEGPLKLSTTGENLVEVKVQTMPTTFEPTTTTERPPSTIPQLQPNAQTIKNNIKISQQQPRPPPLPIDLSAAPVETLGLAETTSHLNDDLKGFAKLCNELAFTFWKSIHADGISPARSVIISPYSLVSMLSMIFLGARGHTSGEMNDVLRLDDMTSFNPHIVFRNISESIEQSRKSGIAAAAFVRELYSDRSKGKLLPYFKEKAQQFYGAHVEEVNFNVINDILRRRTNLLVKRHTFSKINEYLKTNNIWVNEPLAAVSANVFLTDCSGTTMSERDGEMFFQVSPAIRQRRLIPIPAAVYRSGFTAGYDPILDATAVAFGDDLQSTIMVMPGQQGSSIPGDNLERLENAFVDPTNDAWNRLLTTFMERPGLEVQIPRFSHRSLINTTFALQEMGLRDIFDANKADFRGLTGAKSNDLYFSDLLQINQFSTCGEDKIGDAHHIEIYPSPSLKRDLDEGGEEDGKLDIASSDNSKDSMQYKSPFYDPIYDSRYFNVPLPLRPRQARLPENPRLRFDRPFMYFVRHNPTGIILFMGRFNPRLLP